MFLLTGNLQRRKKFDDCLQLHFAFKAFHSLHSPTCSVTFPPGVFPKSLNIIGALLGGICVSLLVKQLFCAAETEMMVQLRGDAVCL